ncbi:MAG: RDD family protein [Alphaproteobacteria bacterium]
MRAVLSQKDRDYHSHARAWADEAPDPLEAPELYYGIRVNRLVVYGIDFIIISLLLVAVWVIDSIFAIITLGQLFPVLVMAAFVLPFACHILQLGGASNATVGMRIMDLRVVAWNGHRPGYPQATFQILSFFGSISIATPLVLALLFFNARSRCLHDFLAGTVTINDLHLDRLRAPREV